MPDHPFEIWSAAYKEWLRAFYGPLLGFTSEESAPGRLAAAPPSPPPVEQDDEEDVYDDESRFSRRPDPDDGELPSTGPQSPRHVFANLIVPPDTRAALELAMDKVVHAKTLFEDFNMKSVDTRGSRAVINFFGPPGTGKTFAAHCVADRLGKKIIEADYSQVESKWFGETEKNITAIFEQARRSDSVLFFDEADTMLGRRIGIASSGDHHVNRTKSVMLIQLERFDGVVVFATNNVANYDPAFARRILAHVEFALPDPDNRRQLWMYLLPAEVPRRENVTPEWLGALSEGFSGGDILNAAWLMATAAAAKPIEERFVTTADAARAIEGVRVGLDAVAGRTRAR